MRAVLAIASLSSLAMFGCGAAEVAESAAPDLVRAQDPTAEPAPAPRRSVRLPTPVGTLGDRCDSEPSQSVTPPEMEWAALPLEIEPRLIVPGPATDDSGAVVHVRHPRDWEHVGGGEIQPIEPGEGVETLVTVGRLSHVSDSLTEFTWDIRIQHLEEAWNVQATDVSSLAGGRCLVTGFGSDGPFEASLSPVDDKTLVAIAEFSDADESEVDLADVPAELRETTRTILNSVEQVDLAESAI